MPYPRRLLVPSDSGSMSRSRIEGLSPCRGSMRAIGGPRPGGTIGRLGVGSQLAPLEQADRVVVMPVGVQADPQGQPAAVIAPVGHAAELDAIVGMLVRTGIEGRQEDIALLVVQLQVRGDEQKVAREPRR